MSSDICVRFGKRLKTLRKKRGWTQVYMAEHIGMDRSFISDLENGKEEICIQWPLRLVVNSWEKRQTDSLAAQGPRKLQDPAHCVRKEFARNVAKFDAPDGCIGAYFGGASGGFSNSLASSGGLIS